MSVLINTEMPTSCQHCFASDDESRFCRVANEYIPMLDKPKFCPLVPVPPHGRLIDADALMRHCVMLPRDGGSLPVVYVSYLRNAPTIIPAEEEA